jgi:uncharacterized lipoprotein
MVAWSSYTKQVLLGAVAVVVAGCSSVTQSSVAHKAGLFPDRDNQYLQAKSLPPLKTPPGVPAIPNDPYYIIPPGSQAQSTPVSMLPPGSLPTK